MAPERIGIGIRRHFTTPGVHPYDEVTWERRDARITNFRDGSIAFEQRDVEVPAFWSQNATNILAQKYFRGQLGTAERETSLKQVADRVTDTIADWGIKDGYFVDDGEAAAFRDELKYLIIHQRAAFNSPVWFNIGVPGVPAQGSACFILAVEDRMDAILDWYKEEGTIFKGGSGSGINLSRIRSSKEHLKGGGTASGPVSFMRGADASAGTIKCLEAGTELVTDDGVKPIAYIRAGEKVLTRFGLRTVEAVHDNGVRPLVRVQTALGDSVRCTPEHRWWVRRNDGEGWVETADLGAGDAICLDLAAAAATGAMQPMVGVDPGHFNEHVHELPAVLDERFALWLGWLWGDGSITDRPGAKFIAMQIGDDDFDLEARYRELTEAIFGSTTHIWSSRHVDKADRSSSVRLSSSGIIRFLAVNGLQKGEAFELRVPRLVVDSPATVRAAFLSGLFEADGHIQNGYPMLSTVSERLAIDVHRLLASVGIPSILKRIDDRSQALGTLPVHTVRVVGCEGVRRFAKLVGFVSDRKHATLLRAVARKDASPFEQTWSLPHCGEELQRVWTAGDARLRRAVAPYVRYGRPRALSLLRARTLVETFPDAFSGTAVERFALGNEFWVPVTTMPEGEGSTFDLTVNGVHEYVAAGLVTHNSGGKTRRAAKMVILNADHPDIEDFIWCKAIEERKARALRDAGFDMDLDGKDSHSIQYQNANNSVRVTDEFMQAVLDDSDWALKAVTTDEVLDTVKARDLFRQIAKAAWECADPGLQFDTTINRWHTAANTGPITASNPCSEYVHLDNSACNLASINLLRFLRDDDSFDVEAYRAAIEVVFTAQEILVGNADYPTEKIAATTRRFRQLGLGYANLGALLMALGLPYDSDEGRAYAAALTAMLTGHAYATSARTAMRMGPFAGYTENKDHMDRVLRMHRDEVAHIDEELVPTELLSAAQESWDTAVELGEEHGVRNSQATVLAPTGCLVGGSLVATSRGLVRLRSLGDVEGAQWQDLDVSVQTDHGPRQASKFYVNGVEPVVDVRTERGHAIRGTAQHRVKIVDTGTGQWEWRRFGDLRPGDLVPLALDQLIGDPQTVPLPPLPDAYWTSDHTTYVPRTMTPELAQFIGYFMGDGSLHARGIRFCVSEADHDVADQLLLLGKQCFGLTGHVARKRGYTEVRFDSVRLVLWWEACGFAKHPPFEGHTGKGYTAHIPDAVLHSNDRQVYAAFLRGLFEADGTVTLGYPHWMTTSLGLAEDVQALMLALGFPTTKTIESKRTGWGPLALSKLRLLNLSYNDRWLEQVGFMSARKDAKVIRGSDLKQGARMDHIPVSRDIVDRLCPENGRLRRVLLMEVKRGTVSRRIATELYDRTGDEELGRLLGYFYDRVETAVLGDEELTYDLSVPEYVTYVANGFVSHNTISFLLDCDTTGIEPDLGLVKSKKLVGGGNMKIVNQTVPRALRRLGFGDAEISDIIAYIDAHDSIVGAPHITEEHLTVFACSMGDNTIHYTGHVRMMGAVQPFISGAISKTVNMPEEASIEDVEQLHIDAWNLGLKAVAIYRDNCKVAQPLSTARRDEATSEPEAHDAELAAKVAQLEQALQSQTVVVKRPLRERLPRRRRSNTFSFRVADCEGYVTVGEYEDGRPGEVFMKVSKQGSTLAGIMDAFSISVSLGLQHGVPLATFVRKYTNMRFEPAGMTDDPDLRIASSLVDYIFRRLAVDYIPLDERAELGILTTGERMQPTLPGIEESTTTNAGIVESPALPEGVRDRVAEDRGPAPAAAAAAAAKDAPYCYQCGNAMQRAGSCFVCTSCGTTSGCS